MVLRKRAKWCEPSPDAGLSGKAGAEERRSRNALWSVKGSQATSEVDTGEASTSRRSNTCCNSELWPWQRWVSIAAGLLLAGLLAVTQAWCVNSLHENLLWFSELTVRVTRDGPPVGGNDVLRYSPKKRPFSCFSSVDGNSDGSLLSTWMKVFCSGNVGAFLARVYIPPLPAWGSGWVRLPPTVQKGDEAHRLIQIAPGCKGFYLPFCWRYDELMVRRMCGS